MYKNRLVYRDLYLWEQTEWVVVFHLQDLGECKLDFLYTWVAILRWEMNQLYIKKTEHEFVIIISYIPG